MNITLIIPTYNEQDNIQAIVGEIQRVFNRISHHNMSILVFDSQSTDKTVLLVQRCQQKWKNVFLVVENEKSGLGSAYIQAMQYAMNELNADAVVEFDADGSHQAKYLIPMIEKMDQGYDVVVGSRYIKGGSIAVDWPWYRRLISIAGNWVSRLFLTRRYKDFSSGYRLTRTSVLKKINLNQLLSKQYAYKIHLLWWLHIVEAKIVEVPIEFLDRTKGESKFPRHNIIDSLYVVLRLRLQRWQTFFKVCLCGLSGMCAQIIAFNLLVLFLHPTASNAIATELAIICNFISNNHYSFSKKRISIKQQRTHYFKKMLQFNLSSFLSLVIQVLVMHLGVHYWGHGWLIYNALLISGIFLGSISNFFLYKKLIWC